MDNTRPDRANPDSATDAPRGSDLARAALADAQRMAGGKPRRGRDARRRAETRRANLRRGGYSGPHTDERDPQPMREVLARLLDEQGWQRPVTEARIFADWAALVGVDVAARCTPVSLVGGELRICAESTAWATQLRLLAATLLARLVAELGPDVVTRLSISGPAGPNWRHGPWIVRGARGPRDTYG